MHTHTHTHTQLEIIQNCLEMYCYCVEVDCEFNEIVWILFGNL